MRRCKDEKKIWRCLKIYIIDSPHTIRRTLRADALGKKHVAKTIEQPCLKPVCICVCVCVFHQPCCNRCSVLLNLSLFALCYTVGHGKDDYSYKIPKHGHREVRQTRPLSLALLEFAPHQQIWSLCQETKKKVRQIGKDPLPGEVRTPCQQPSGTYACPWYLQQRKKNRNKEHSWIMTLIGRATEWWRKDKFDARENSLVSYKDESISIRSGHKQKAYVLGLLQEQARLAWTKCSCSTPVLSNIKREQPPLRYLRSKCFNPLSQNWCPCCICWRMCMRTSRSMSWKGSKADLISADRWLELAVLTSSSQKPDPADAMPRSWQAAVTLPSSIESIGRQR